MTQRGNEGRVIPEMASQDEAFPATMENRDSERAQGTEGEKVSIGGAAESTFGRGYPLESWFPRAG